MLNVQFDADSLRQIIREEVRAAIADRLDGDKLPPLLTRVEAMNLLRIKSWKMSELMARPDFPVMREAGVLIPRDKLFIWIDRNTRWVEDNTGYYEAG